MSEINDIVDVNITRETQAIATTSFDKALLMVQDVGTPVMEDEEEIGREYMQTQRVVEYSSLDEVFEVFGVDSVAYLKTQKLLSGKNPPNRFKIGVIRDGESASQALNTILGYDDEWYALSMESHTSGDVLAVAGIIQTQRKLFFTSSGEADILDSASTTDIGSILSDSGMDRTVVIYLEDADNEYPEDAWMGGNLTKVIGSFTWEYKTLTSVPVSRNLSTNDIATLRTKNVNYYTRVLGALITRRGKTSEGSWIDEVQIEDWLHARLQEELFGLLVRKDKVPMTTDGVSMVEARIRDVFAQAIANGAIDTYTLVVPRILTISENDRINRILGDFKFDARMQGAVSVIRIRGVLTY